MKGITCDWGYGPCTAPRGKCPHWVGTFCDLDVCEELNSKSMDGMTNREKYESLLYKYIEACKRYETTEDLNAWQECYELKDKIINLMLKGSR